MSKLLIGIAGTAYNGKSLAASILTQHLELREQTFAAPIINACANATGIIPHDFKQLPKDALIPGFKFTPRIIMQAIGKALREADPLFMIKHLEHRINDITTIDQQLFNGHLISDVRMPTEARWIRKNNGLLIHISRKDAPKTNPDITEKTLPIEAGDLHITNNGTIEELHTKLIHIVQDTLTKQAA